MVGNDDEKNSYKHQTHIERKDGDLHNPKEEDRGKRDMTEGTYNSL